MIVMLNGAFGSGKTTTAYALHDVLPNSTVFDPEEVGYMLRNITFSTGLEPPGDFQDIALWPSMVVTVTRALKYQYQKHLILPISLPCQAYFQHIVQGITEFEPEFYHFCLLASESTLARRIQVRDGENGAWALQQISRCIEAFASQDYEEKLDTETHSTEELVTKIFNRITRSSL